MLIFLDIVAPVFGVVLIGFIAARSGFMGQTSVKGLSLFVFNFAIPPLLFRTIVNTDLPDKIEWGFLLSYYLGAYGVWAIGGIISCIIFQRSFVRGSIAGMAAGFSNTVMLGIPLVLTTYGDEASVPLFLLIAVHSTILISTITILVEGARGGSSELAQIPVNVGKGILQNPIIMSLLIGLAFNFFTIPVPNVANQIIDLLGKAAIPCALFSMGASLAAYKITGDLPESMTTVLLKLVGHPLLVWLLATYVFDVEPLWRNVAILVAAVPIGINVYLFAQRYNAGPAPAATSMILSTALGTVTVSVLLYLMEVR